MDDLFDAGYTPINPEPNDTRDTATPLDTGNYGVTGNGIDWFALTGQARGRIDVNMTSVEDINLNMILFNPDGAPVRGVLSDRIDGGFEYIVPATGTYYLQVTTANFGENPPADLTASYALDVVLPAFIEPDGNDTRATASPITDGTHEIIGTGVDWFRFESPPGILSIDMQPEGHLPEGDPRNAPRDLVVRLFDSAGRELVASGDGFSHFVTTTDTYYLNIHQSNARVDAPDDLILSYTLDVDIPAARPADGNDTRATATPLDEGLQTISGSGVDWFRFESPAGFASLEMTPLATDDLPAQDLRMVLFNAQGQAIRAEPVVGNGPESFTHFLPSQGTYYVKISSALHPDDATSAGFPLDYTLSLSLPEAIIPNGNGDIENARPLGAGTHNMLGTQVDWFELDTPLGMISIDLEAGSNLPDGDPRNTPRNLNIELYNSAGVAVASSTSSSFSESINYFAPVPGPYFLKVLDAQFGDDAPADLILNYDLDIRLPTALEPDGNDSMDTATPLTEGSQVISGTGQDWFRFDSPSGDIKLSMRPLAGDDVPVQDLNIVLFDPEGEPLRSGSDTGTGTKSFTHLAGFGGTFFVQISPAMFGNDATPEGFPLNYELSLELPVPVAPDGNETRANALPIDAGQITRSGVGVDWFRFETGPGQVTALMTPIETDTQEALDLNMELVNEAGESIRMNFVEGPEAEEISFLAPATGVYYLKVYWAPYEEGAPNGYFLNYTLDLDLPVNTWSVTLDYGPIRAASLTTFDINNNGFHEIFVPTAKALDEDKNEIRPAGLIALNHDGTILWEQTFPAFDGPDSQTGLTYQTSSVTSPPVFADVTGDGRINILVGTGADNYDPEIAGQPGDLGALYALDSDGTILWRHVTRDSFGGPNEDGIELPDGRPDGVHGAPRVFDIDGDGRPEVIFTSWDHYLYILDGRTGRLEREVDLHDTAAATPAVADLTGNGVFELVVPADVTDNPAAGLTEQGGILHILSNYGVHNVPGWDQQVQETTHPDFRGRFEEQGLWSSPQIVDLDRSGRPEIVVGTGNFFQDERGQFIRVWNADGTLRVTLDTIGRTLASPLIADINGDGQPEIVAVTLEGYVHAWTAAGTPLFATQARPFTLNGELDDDGLPFVDDTDTDKGLPIARAPIAVDLNGDGRLEILVSIGSQMVILDADGNQITNLDRAERVFNTYAGSPIARDIDGDGRIDLISGGTTESQDQAIVFRFENPLEIVGTPGRTAAYQEVQSLHNIQAFVERFYSTILGREADPAGNNGWTDALHTGRLAGADVARGFVGSAEFVNRNTTDTEFVATLYRAFFGRAPDAGLDAWVAQLESGVERMSVLDGFIGSREFTNLATSFGIIAERATPAWSTEDVIIGTSMQSDVLRGGPGDRIIFDGDMTSVTGYGAFETQTAGQVYRLYEAILGRGADYGGFQAWFDGITEGRITLEQVAASFTGSREFMNVYGALDDAGFVSLLYQNVLGRSASDAEIDAWLARMEVTEEPTQERTEEQIRAQIRAQVALGFANSQEFIRESNPRLDQFMRLAQPNWNDVIEGGPGNDTMNGGMGADTFIFRRGQGGDDVIHGLDPWDELQLSGFGFVNPSDALARMTQAGPDVVFDHMGQRITFTDTRLQDMSRLRFNLS